MATAMKCPACGCAESEVKDSRPSNTVGTRRRRQCVSCGHRFTTGEFVIETFARVPAADSAARR